MSVTTEQCHINITKCHINIPKCHINIPIYVLLFVMLMLHFVMLIEQNQFDATKKPVCSINLSLLYTESNIFFELKQGLYVNFFANTILPKKMQG